jgi:hypothetical protein
MATRSTIALEYADGTVEQVYCHWDGYLDNNGRILLEHWSDPSKLQQLIDLGDLSSLSKEIGEKHGFDNPHKWGTDEHISWREKYADWCLFYGRDRGEEGVEKRKYENYQQYLKTGQQEEYNYILRQIDGGAVWLVAYYKTNDRFVKLETAIAEERKEEEEVE